MFCKFVHLMIILIPQLLQAPPSKGPSAPKKGAVAVPAKKKASSSSEEDSSDDDSDSDDVSLK